MQPYFQTTIWALIREARDRRGAALDDLARRYWEPIRRFVERRGVSPQDAEDIAQEVLTEICREDFLRKADASKGRFRSLLLAVTRHVLHMRLRQEGALKRGGEVHIGSLEQEPEATPEERADYNRLWAAHVMKVALERLRFGNPAYAEAIELHYFQDVAYKDIAARLGRQEYDVKNFIFQGKKRLRDHLEQVIREYSSSPEEVAEELDELSGFLP
ncbi:MAG: sigma-70 family RNA polymerase sigma factor [Planctomycetes bacterium]|nr:sigma-70 family RNA polymerase sigma factor [Planctomycetota bacterium]